MPNGAVVLVEGTAEGRASATAGGGGGALPTPKGSHEEAKATARRHRVGSSSSASTISWGDGGDAGLGWRSGNSVPGPPQGARVRSMERKARERRGERASRAEEEKDASERGRNRAHVAKG